MAFYRFRFLGQAPSVLENVFDCFDDLEALDRAELKATDCDVEVWRDGRFVARVKKGNEASTAYDTVSG